MSIVKKLWIFGMLVMPMAFFFINGLKISSIDSGPFYGLALIMAGFPLSGLAVHLYSSVIIDFIFKLLVPVYEPEFYFYQANIQWFVYWLFAFLAGYIQWFFALPWVIGKVCQKRT
ncbi:hypothetical protein [Pelagibaculum spongiae]|uniref:Uncharacterized protein n=1 Tax=Pelagibaculum spongiae TaxID=2080658 RepID=A0A2V1GY12_9GAMM|nr:hypothetical protein [Pelagibaculum spongiae]PVZ69525.1 hypothetical protein DC094_09350 [Pelagibaculum spongiae]